MYHTCVGSADPDRSVHQQHDVPSPAAEVDDGDDRRQLDRRRRTSDEGQWLFRSYSRARKRAPK